MGSKNKEQFKYDDISVLSRNETEQYKLKIKYGSALNLLIGDVRDYEVTHKSMDGVDAVIHAAAIKHIDVAEKNPFEAIKTNIQGTQNVLRAAMSQNVRRLINISTDKTCNPNSTYGATKLIGERLTTAIAIDGDLDYSTCRFGNILGSNGSVFQLWKNLARDKRPIPITSLEMTRFFITIEKSARFVLDQMSKPGKGSIFVPLLNSFSMRELASHIAPESKLQVIGLRPGEKIHEDLVNASELEHATFTEEVIEIFPSELKSVKSKFSKAPSLHQIKDLISDEWFCSNQINELDSEINRFYNIYSMSNQDMREYLNCL